MACLRETEVGNTEETASGNQRSTKPITSRSTTPVTPDISSTPRNMKFLPGIDIDYQKSSLSGSSNSVTYDKLNTKIYHKDQKCY